ncbi:tyrosine-type recombinase/integrase [Shewanella sp. SM32]|jgi:site-specific recombinase XerD|uniref:tyrosine-type recombinase/integrase n=1 Tax=Shewanella sp. SM32 TaxID=2912796 RepID=UPI0021D8D6D1|nr:site-specific integrase [Shewanella sp. SM32]MCU8071571.1 site-specific integrase [Shewanella sp. SM32]
MRFRIKFISHPEYENQHIPMVVDSDCAEFPEPSAALWGWSLWLSHPLNTVEGRLRDLCVFYEFVEKECQHFFEDAAALKLLTMRDVNRLSSFLLINFQHELSNGVMVKPSTFNRRIDSVSKFLRFHYTRYIERVNDLEKADTINKKMNSIISFFSKKKYSKSEVENQTNVSEPLSEADLDLITTIIRPSKDNFINEVNPFRTQLQVRNACLIMLMCELGGRISEIVLFHCNDNDLRLTTNPTVRIQQQSKNNPAFRGRKDSASHKTRNRELPISRGLADLLIEYIEDYRPKLRRPCQGKLTDYLFVSEKDGGPMTTSGVTHVLKSVFKDHPYLKSLIHPHRLRTTRITQLREGVDKSFDGKNSPMIKAGEMQDILTTWGGWSTTSTMPRRYTNAHLQRKLNEYLKGVGKK